jgi:hypothetical protein
MSWLTRLLGLENKSVEKEESVSDADIKSPWADFDWKEAETGIAHLFERDLRKFVSAHKGETFYSVAVDCNSLYGDLLLSANTSDALERMAKSYASSGSEEEIAREIEELRWGFGDWEYHGFNCGVEGGNARYKELLPATDSMEHPDDRTLFLESVTRALLRVEASGVFSEMLKTHDFKVLCKDDEEELEDAEERIQRLRGADS